MNLNISEKSTAQSDKVKDCILLIASMDSSSILLNLGVHKFKKIYNVYSIYNEYKNKDSKKNKHIREKIQDLNTL